MTKLPEPLKTFEYAKGKCQDLYSKAQMLQFRRDALEEAAMVCDKTDIFTYTFAGQLYDSGAETLGKAVDAIRKLKDET
jgi:hypothetical protein